MSSVESPPDLDELERQYRLESALAERLWDASPDERRGLYSEAYDELFDAFPRLAGGSEQARRARAAQLSLELQLLEPFLSPGIRVVEFGAGDGEVARHLAGRVRKAWAVDASTRLARRSSDPENFEVIVSGDASGRLQQASIDLAYSCHFVEHLHPEDLRAHLRGVFRLLAPGGRYLCITPNRILGPHDVSKYFETVASGLHLREYNHGELCREFRRAGFARVRVVRKVGVLPGPGTTVPYLLAEAVAGWLPRALRLRLLSIRSEPFRVFEQVKVSAQKAGGSS